MKRSTYRSSEPAGLRPGVWNKTGLAGEQEGSLLSPPWCREKYFTRLSHVHFKNPAVSIVYDRD